VHRLLVVAALLLAGCSTGSDPDVAAPPTPPAASAATSAAPSTSPAPADEDDHVTSLGVKVQRRDARVPRHGGEQWFLRAQQPTSPRRSTPRLRPVRRDLVPGQTSSTAFRATWRVR
jgi:hypothetical protein